MTEAKMQERRRVQPGTFCWVELGNLAMASRQKVLHPVV
jgi:hypothetical protein